jgi:Transglycosylase SLT domain/SPOR domain
MIKRIVSLALLALALAMPGPAEGETVTREPAGPDDRGKAASAVKPVTVDRICTLIAAEAKANSIPPEFFARLIWKESRFDHQAVSPAGAQGIAQFMPGTAKLRELQDPFNIDEAIPASATFLAELKRNMGNFGLAAAAYNAGEGRVSRWMSSGGFLPLETEEYVLDVTGEPADNFVSRGAEVTAKPLDAKLTFDEGCRKLPVIAFNTIAMSTIHVKPWGVQVAGNFRRSAAVNQYERVRRQFNSVLANHKPVVSRVRTPIGRRGIYAVRIGANSRAEADKICAALRSSGGACIVMKNR